MANLNPLRKTDYYNGNPRLKRQDVRMELEDWQLDELEKCEDDIIYFVKNYMKITHVDDGLVAFKPYDYQEKLLHHLKDNRFSIILSARQTGKCLGENTIINLKNKYNGCIETMTIGDLWRIQKEKRAKLLAQYAEQ